MAVETQNMRKDLEDKERLTRILEERIDHYQKENTSLLAQTSDLQKELRVERSKFESLRLKHNEMNSTNVVLRGQNNIQVENEHIILNNNRGLAEELSSMEQKYRTLMQQNEIL